MPLYLIASNYYDHETDLVGRQYTADSPFAACLQDCMTSCNIPQHEAAQYLSEGSYQLTMWVIQQNGAPKHLTYSDIDYPWRAISRLVDEIVAIEKALEQATAMEFLLALPTMSEQQQVFDLQPARDYLAVKIAERDRLQSRWHAIQTAPNEGKELRSIQVDTEVSSAGN